MTNEFWKELQGSTLDGRFHLTTLVDAGTEHAEYAGPEGTVTVMTAGEDGDAQLAAMQDACRLSHPNLLRLLGAGRAERKGTPLLYLASEKTDSPLEDIRALPPDQRDALDNALRHGLDYLHQQGLAYNNLVPETIVRAGGAWKLADYGSMSPLTPERKTADLAARAALLAIPRKAAVEPAPAVAARPIAAVPVERKAVHEPAFLGSSAKPSFLASPMAKIAVAGGGVAALALLFWGTSQSTPKAAPNVITPVVYNDRPAPVPAKPATTHPAAPPQTTTTSPRVMSAAPKPQQTATAKATPPPVAPVVAPTPNPASVEGRSALKAKPDASAQIGRASFFSDTMNGHRTASGEIVNSNEYTAAHRSHPIGGKLRVTNVKNGKSVIVRVNDRGAYGQGQALVVSPRVARELDFLAAGSATVRVEPVR